MRQRDTKTSAPPPRSSTSAPLNRAAAARAARAREIRMRRIRTISIIAGTTAVLVIAVVAYFVLRGDTVNGGVTALPGETAWKPVAAPGTPFPVSGANDHTTNINEKIAYNSDPPTSGRHYFQWARPGPQNTTVPDVMLGHNLEHGYVIIDYNCQPGGCPDLADKLNQIAQSYPKVIANPRPDPALPRIALAAWGHMDAFNLYNEDRIKNFINVWMNNHDAPEWNVAP